MRSGCLHSQYCVHKLIQTMLILLVVNPTLAGSPPWWSGSQGGVGAPDAVPPPEFDIATPSSRRLSVLAGQTALLPCTVRNLADKVVSWIRTRDLHILTSGIHIFTSDNRFEVMYTPGTDYWGLKIKNTQISDTGKYECQVNTDPKMNYAVLLTVTDSHMHDSPMVAEGRRAELRGTGNDAAAIQGPREQHVRVGSTVTFTCVVSRTARGPPAPLSSRAQLKWTHAGRDVTFQSSRGGISVDTDYRPERISSSLTVAMVTPQDAGDYTCQDGAHVMPDTVTLQVFEGERSEAMQRNPPNGAFAFSRRNSLLPLLFVYFNWILR